MTSGRLASAPVRAGFVAAGAFVSGLGSYLLLIIVARALDAEQYSEFAAFWALTVTAGLGLFFPIEQETARESSGADRASSGFGLLRVVATSAGVIVLLGTVASLALLLPGGQVLIGSPPLVLALVCSLVGYALQFSLRGFLSGAQRTIPYSLVIVVEGLLRIVLPLALFALGLSSAFGYALTVGVSAVLAIVPVLALRDRSWMRHDAVGVRLYLGRLARLVGAALSIQLLLNSGTLLGRVDATVLAGQILVCLSIARVPVFVYQVAQMLYLPRLAAAWKAGDGRELRRTLAVALGLASIVGMLIVVGMAWLGAPVIGWLFDPSLVLSEAGIVLVSAGVAVFLVALVASDGALAFSRHTAVLRSWIVAVAVAVVAAVVIPDPLLRATVPLLAGALAALLQLAVTLVRAVKVFGPGR